MSVNFSDMDRTDKDRYLDMRQVCASLREKNSHYHHLRFSDGTFPRTRHNPPPELLEHGIKPTIGKTAEPVIEITLRSGWISKYYNSYGNTPATIVVGPPNGLVGSSDMGAGGNGIYDYTNGKPIGTLERQMFVSAGDLVTLVLEQGWHSIRIEQGSPNMKWALWTVATHNKLEVLDYEPDDEGKAKSARVDDLVAQEFNFAAILAEAIKLAKNPALTATPGSNSFGNNSGSMHKVGVLRLNESQVNAVAQGAAEQTSSDDDGDQ